MEESGYLNDFPVSPTSSIDSGPSLTSSHNSSHSGDSDPEDEASFFLGANPEKNSQEEISVSKDIAARLLSWTKGGLDKNEKEYLLNSIPRKGPVYLEAPAMNQELNIRLQHNVLARDDHFKDFQNLLGSSLSSSAKALDTILRDKEEPIDRKMLLKNLSDSVKLQADLFFTLMEARKLLAVGCFSEKIQKAFKILGSSEVLFNGDVEKLIASDNAIVIQRSNFDQKNYPKSYGRGYDGSYNRNEGYSNPNRLKPYPGKKSYAQTQPTDHRRRR